MTQEPERQLTPEQAVVAQVRDPRFLEQVQAALPEGMPASRFVRATVTALLENPDLTGAQPRSLFQAVLRSAQDGLLPDGREAALVLFKQKGEAQPRAQYLPMIGGYRKVAAEHGWALRTAVVYEADEFEYELGLEPRVVHKPPPVGTMRGEPVAAYAVGRHQGTGAVEFEVMTAADIAKVRRTSRAKDHGPWVEWPERMWEKTVGKRLFKKLPLADRERVRSMLDADELAPAKAEELVYGELPKALTGGSAEGNGEGRVTAAPDPTPEAAGTVQKEGPAAPYTGEEPAQGGVAALPSEHVLPEEFTRYAGKTLGQVAEAGDAEYLEWLSSDAISDAELRSAAAEVRASVEK